MVTGVEAVGLVLAILPLLVNQIDNYVQGLQTIKSFRSRQARRELEGHCTMLGTQQTILLNTLERALEGIVDYDDKIRDLMSNPDAQLWHDKGFRDALQQKLGRNYLSFNKLMLELSQDLQDLSEKLGLDENGSKKVQWDDISTAERQILKFKTIFSKSVYNSLLGKINTANSLLKTLVDQYQYQETSRRKWKQSKLPLAKLRNARTMARSLYRAMVEGKCWSCSDTHQHSIQFHLNIELNNNEESAGSAENPKFQIVCLSTPTTQSTASSTWHEIEVESLTILHNANIVKSNLSTSLASNIPRNSKSGKRRVQVAITTVNESSASTMTDLRPSCPPITNMCSALFNAGTELQGPQLLGFLPSETYEHRIYLARHFAGDLHGRSLEELLTQYSNLTGPLAKVKSVFNQNDRLSLTTKFACGVLQLGGSWLQPYWRARDILISRSQNEIMRPYVNLDIGRGNGGSNVLLPPLIRSDKLFSLGLILVELSLCCPISSLRTAEDETSNEVLENFNTVSRNLESVYLESGIRYGEVVEKCLFGHGLMDGKCEDEAQERLLEAILIPLFEDLKAFQGRMNL